MKETRCSIGNDNFTSKVSYDFKPIDNLAMSKSTIGAILHNSIRGSMRLQKLARTLINTLM